MSWLMNPYTLNINTFGAYISVVVALVIVTVILLFMWNVERSKAALYAAVVESAIAIYLIVFIVIVNASNPDTLFRHSRILYLMFMLVSVLAVWTAAYTSKRRMLYLKIISLLSTVVLAFMTYYNETWLICRTYNVATFYVAVKGPGILFVLAYMFLLGLFLGLELFFLWRSDKKVFNLVWPIFAGMIFVCFWSDAVGIMTNYYPTIKPMLYVNALGFSVFLVIYLFKTLREIISQRNMAIDAYTRDWLTGIYTRDYILEMLNTYHSRSEDRAYLVMIDLDGFKIINDNDGHVKGDQVLKAFGGMLKAQCCAQWLPGRIGGDEFLILIRDDKLEAIMACLENLMAEYQYLIEDLCPNSQELGIGLSIGVSELNKNLDSDEILRRVDTLLYEAKNGGKNRIVTDFGESYVLK